LLRFVVLESGPLVLRRDRRRSLRCSCAADVPGCAWMLRLESADRSALAGRMACAAAVAATSTTTSTEPPFVMLLMGSSL
jgi:hypothetical protein